MRNAAVALLAGLVFGLGLVVSDMKSSAKVLAFLDVAGRWDPSLLFVMLGAVGVGAIAFALAKRLVAPLFGGRMHLPTAQAIDRRLLGGALLFGVGWGLVGICPGPALVAIGMGEAKAIVFVAAMLAGMVLFEALERRRSKP